MKQSPNTLRSSRTTASHLALPCKIRGSWTRPSRPTARRSGLSPTTCKAYSGLVLALKDQGKLDEAVAAYREAIRLKPDNALAHFNLGGVLRAQGDFAGSLAMFRKGHELGSKQPGWRHPSAQWVADAEGKATLAPRLTAVLKGKDRPKDNAERLSLASMCQESNRFAAAARLTAEALETDPKLGDVLQRPSRRHQQLPSFPNGNIHVGTLLGSRRHDAASYAALAGVGQGVDDPRPDEAARNRLRTQARDWIRADLELCSKKLDAGNAMDCFARLAGPSALEGVPRPGRHPRLGGPGQTPGGRTEGMAGAVGAGRGVGVEGRRSRGAAHRRVGGGAGTGVEDGGSDLEGGINRFA